jgi:hypothetical protein
VYKHSDWYVILQSDCRHFFSFLVTRHISVTIIVHNFVQNLFVRILWALLDS